MKKYIRRIFNATALFLLFYFFRQSINYIVGENGDFFVGNFDLFYLFGLVYVGGYLFSHRKIRVSKSVFVCALLLLSLVLIQALVLPEVSTLKIVINAAKIVVCFFVMMYVKDNVIRIDLKYFCFGFGILCAIFLVLSFIFPDSILWRHNDYVNVFSQNRLQFLFSEPSELGLHAIIVLLFAFDLFFTEKKKTLRSTFSYFALIFIPIGISLYFAKPLGAVGFGMVAVLVYLVAQFISGKNKRTMAMSFFGVVALAVVGIIVFTLGDSNLSLRLNSIMRGTDSSVSYRVSVPIKVVERSLVDSNGIGLGLGNAKMENNVARYNEIGLGSAGVINSFVNLIVEGGVIGAIFVIILIIALVKAAIREKDSLKMALATFIILFQFAGTYFTNPLCWLVYGYIFFYKKPTNRLRSSDEKKEPILFLDDNINTVGGVERVLSTLADSLVTKYDVTVISKDLTRAEPFYKYDDRVRRLYLINKLDTDCFSSLKNKIERIFFLKTRLIKLLEEYEKPPKVIVFGRVSNAIIFLPVIASVFEERMPKIIVRDAIHLEFLSVSQREKMRSLFPRYVNTLVVSSHESLKAYNLFFGVDRPRMEIIYNPIGIKPKQKYDFGSKTLVAFGRMDDNQKGFDTLISSFYFVHKRYPDWRLRLYGEGKMKDSYMEKAKEIGIDSFIDFKQATNDVVDALNHSSIFVFPSRYEGYANSLVEALACGVPAVTFNWLMGADEIIKNGINGSIVRLNNREAYFRGDNNVIDQKRFSDEVCKIIGQPEIARKYSKNGPLISENRSIDVVVEQWMQLITDNGV